MSSKIEVQRICQYCKKEFTARTTVTKYCSHKCNQRAYKAKKSDLKKLRNQLVKQGKKRSNLLSNLKPKNF